MAIGDIDRTVGPDRHRIGLMEVGVIVASHAGGAQCHQHLAVLVELDHVIADLAVVMVVGDPDMVALVDEEAVREEQLAGPERLDEVPLIVELHHRIEIAAFAIVGAAAFDDPDIALAVAGNCAGRAHMAAARQMEIILIFGIGLGIGILVLGQRGGHEQRRRNEQAI